MQYFIITHPEPVKNETAILNYILDQNLCTVHLRKPDFSEQEMAKLIDKIRPLNRKKIVIHSHHRLAFKHPLKGIHLTHHNKKNIPEFISYDGSKSISCHSLTEIEELTSDFNYYFISPIFSSVSKPGYGTDGIDMNALHRYTSNNPNKKLVGLSGITPKNIKLLDKSLLFGAAILGTFWNYCANIKNIEDTAYFFQQLDDAIHSND